MRKSRAQRKKQKSKVSQIVSIILGAIVVCGIGYFLLLERSEMGKEEQHEADSASVTVSIEDPKNSVMDEKREPSINTSVEVDEGGYAIVQGEVINPTYINGVLLANKKFPLPKTYNPGEDPKAKQAMDNLILAAKEAGFSLIAFSSFRSYDYQTNLYDKYVARDGKANADRYSARPGHSEHQTGLAFDVGEIGQEDLWLTSEFGETPAAKWLAKNAHHYGFILRYPEGKEDITGFMHESWHFRYLGKELATKVYESGLTLEEYLGVE